MFSVFYVSLGITPTPSNKALKLQQFYAFVNLGEEGNAAYKEENYGLASVHYRRGLLQFDYTFPETPELQYTNIFSIYICTIHLLYMETSKYKIQGRK